MDEAEFKVVVYDTMRRAFALHNEMGGLFDEKIYQRELARRIPGAQREIPIEVCFEDFRKTYFMDLLVAGGAAFELKAVEALTDRHRGQLLNYLYLADLPHGKLLNFRPERVKHEFINAPLSGRRRREFSVIDAGWQDGGQSALKEKMAALVSDWGTGLDVGLYQEAASHLCGRAAEPESEVEVCVDGHPIGIQRVRLAQSTVAMVVSTLPAARLATLELHLQQFLDHTRLHSIQSINITHHSVQFKTLSR